jgi:sulfur-oxidizing protein SoxA
MNKLEQEMGTRSRYIRRLVLEYGLSIIAVMAMIVAATAFQPVSAQTEEETRRGLERFRAMLREDPWSNPGLLDADRGEALWKMPAGANNVSLETCDLGLGPGVVEGAFAQLPRYFADAARVMDAETRILWCMETIQGRDMAEFRRRPHPGSAQSVKEVGAIATWAASLSAGMPFRLDHASEPLKAAVALGEELFMRRAGPFDFSCATCHSAQGLRIRLQDLPNLPNPEEARNIVGEWPGYRVSSTHVMTMQHRLYDCFWQMRMPQLDFGSEASVALTAYLVAKAEGGAVAAPSIKR